MFSFFTLNFPGPKLHASNCPLPDYSEILTATLISIWSYFYRAQESGMLNHHSNSFSTIAKYLVCPSFLNNALKGVQKQ